jgi:hypothetical protein
VKRLCLRLHGRLDPSENCVLFHRCLERLWAGSQESNRKVYFTVQLNATSASNLATHADGIGLLFALPPPFRRKGIRLAKASARHFLTMLVDLTRAVGTT